MLNLTLHGFPYVKSVTPNLGDSATKTLGQLQVEEDDEERFQADLERAVRQSLGKFLLIPCLLSLYFTTFYDFTFLTMPTTWALREQNQFSSFDAFWPMNLTSLSKLHFSIFFKVFEH